MYITDLGNKEKETAGSAQIAREIASIEGACKEVYDGLHNKKRLPSMAYVGLHIHKWLWQDLMANIKADLEVVEKKTTQKQKGGAQENGHIAQ